MCGFAGFIKLDGGLLINESSTRSILEAMSIRLRHRGPDGDGVFVNEHCAFAHRRLSVIGVEDGAQPWVSDDKRFVLVFNGEIYNHKELRRYLESKGFNHKTNCDTETLMYAYQHWGRDVVKHLRGMFSFVFWDNVKKRVFAVRDRLGLKPLFYYHDANLFVFASELKALISHPAIPRTLNKDAICDYLRLGYLPAPLTPFHKSNKLESGHCVEIEGYELAKTQYWCAKDHALPETGPRDYGLAVDDLREKINDAVSCRTESEVPIGAFLSGGLDSSAVTASASKCFPGGLKTYCFRFPNEHDESKYSEQVSKLFNTDHAEADVQQDLAKDIKRILWHMDEPFADDSAVPMYYLCKEAKQKMTVALSGDGGDEVFAGYDWYRQIQVNDRISRALPSWAVKALSQYAPLFAWTGFRGQSLLYSLGKSAAEQHSSLRSLFTDHEISELLGQSNSDFSTHPIIKKHSDLGIRSDNVLAAQLVDFDLYLAEDILMKVDKMSMAHGLEVRAPLLDHHLVEYTLSLQTEFKTLKGNKKRIFKSAYIHELPENIINRPKQGFTPPLEGWLLNELYPLVDYYLLSEGNNSGLLNTTAVKKLWRRFKWHCKFPLVYVDISRKIWALLAFEIWYQLYIKEFDKKEYLN